VKEALKEVDRKRLRDLDMELEHDEITQLGHTNRVTRLLKAAGVLPTPKAADATTTVETTEPSTTASPEVTETTVEAVEEVEETTLDAAAHADARASALEDQVAALTTLVGELRGELDALKSAESPVATGITTEKKETKKTKTTATAAKRPVSAGAAKDVDKSTRPAKAHPKAKATATHTKPLHASSLPTKAKRTASKPTATVEPRAAAAKAEATKKKMMMTKKKKLKTAKVVTPTHLTPTVGRKKGPSTKPKARPTKKPTRKPASSKST